MTALGRKARLTCGDPATICTLTRPDSRRSGTALLECEPEHPPRLCQKDLQDPERFHQRLVDWLMKQR
jgi:hypothetical protein